MEFITNAPQTNANVENEGVKNYDPELARDVLAGLTQTPKSLSSKYFYDGAGSKLFQQIMELPEYYPTRTEFKILEEQQAEIAGFFGLTDFFHLVELGAGDGLKTKILLRQLLHMKADFEYVPVDISGDILKQLESSLQTELPALRTESFAGDYFKALHWLQHNKEGRKVVLFLGSNIGNFEDNGDLEFLQEIRKYLKPEDKVLVGFDLRKDPRTIRQAYDDAAGVTAAFNLNLLKRLNRELGADFNLKQFEHFTDYDPLEGVVKSYLVSKKQQTVTFSALNHRVSFAAWEAIHTENSHKYTPAQIEELGKKAGLKSEQFFTDEKHYFADVLFRVM
ncbi:L-histidine N(alpha)-methyltransferase [Adhaeribacter sp. BT258]|uniref:L-histidine N(Alpha)-methyltransferase n=1 Tax=Adhaeribacter terrigena TaxID=2793070 RepID=A0ABS1C7V5_9BACT|nr:L-histidine N(alpha)-methyltransferase [Adhaeribacter terrigena]MBK0404675.1 L-histidine N(alpha)-methyltransferase [Adhaeribacter terrigena]